MTALVALGANISSGRGNPAQTLHQALQSITTEGLVIRAVSRFFRTPCFPVGAGPDYVNAAIALDHSGPAPDLLGQLHQIEATFGRVRKERWGARVLDLDLLALDDLVLPDVPTFAKWRELDPALQAKAVPDQLILPHPRMQDRGFVLVPLSDIAPNWVHPILGQSVHHMLTELSPAETRDIVPI